MLKNDFELILMQNLLLQKAVFLQEGEMLHHVFETPKATNHYVTNAHCTQLLRIEKIVKHKIKVKIGLQNYQNGLFDSIGIAHQNFNLQIGLKRLE